MLLKSKILYIVYNIVLLLFAYLFDSFFQMLLFITFYEFLQSCFKYRFHSDTIIDEPIKAIGYCKLITVLVELLYLFYCKNVDISFYANIFIILIICFISCLLQFYLEKKIKFNDIFKNKDKLIEACKNANLSENATNRLIMKYIEGKKYREIADIECVDEGTIAISIMRSKKKLKN